MSTIADAVRKITDLGDDRPMGPVTAHGQRPMFLGFYNGPEKFFGNLIRWWTWSPYSHVELVFSDGRRFSSIAGYGVGFQQPALTTALVESMREQAEVHRTAAATAGQRFHPPIFKGLRAGWDYVPVWPLDEGKVIEWCWQQRGDKYDWPGIFFSQVFPLGRRAYSKWFCSELCVSGLQQGGMLHNVCPQATSPGDLFTIVTEV